MPRISATGIKGFTLIEVLVVVAITGIVIAVASINLFPSDNEIARRESGMVALAIEGARDAAWLGGRPTSVTIEKAALRAWRYSAGEWRADPAHDRPLEGSMRVTAIHVDGQALQPGDRLVFMPDGLGTPFRMALEVRGLPWAVEGDAAGAVTLVPG
jgi:type II secretion system protein H